MTQRDRVLRALKQAGSYGITQIDFSVQGTPDGGPSIWRVAARVHELRSEGHSIVDAGERDGHTVYRLVEPRPAPVDPVVDPVDESGLLFEMEPDRPSFESMITWDDEAGVSRRRRT